MLKAILFYIDICSIIVHAVVVQTTIVWSIINLLPAILHTEYITQVAFSHLYQQYLTESYKYCLRNQIVTRLLWNPSF